MIWLPPVFRAAERTPGFFFGGHTLKAILFESGPVRWVVCRMAGAVSRRAYWSRLSGLRLREVPVPELPTENWVRLRTILGGVCGTDLGTILQRAHPATFLASLSAMPIGLGHEGVARIESVGANVRGFKPGDRVVVEPSLSCAVREIDPPCARCAAGTFSLCEFTDRGTIPPGLMLGYNHFTGGTWGEYFVAHQWQLYRVPESVSDEHAVLVDPLSCALHGVLRHQPAESERVLVQGGGIIGLGVIAALRALGCRAEVTALVRPGFQEELARQLGANQVIGVRGSDASRDRYDRIAEHVGGRRVPGRFGNQGLFGGFDVVYNCVGSGAAMTDAAKFTRARGTLVQLGTGTISVVDTTPLWFAELNLFGCSGRQIEDFNGRKRHTYQALFDLMAKGQIDMSAFPAKSYRLAEYRNALVELVAGSTRECVKVSLRPEADGKS